MTANFSNNLKSFDVLGIGEVLVGFHDAEKSRTREHAVISGDIFNTLSACHQIGLKTALLSAVGEDEYTAAIISALEKKSINTDYVTFDTHSPNGIYWVTPEGPHRFEYHRSKSAFSRLSEPDNLREIIASAKIIYATGVTCAISEAMFETVLESFKLAKSLGIKTAFDLNYRPNLWKQFSKKIVQSKLEELYPYVDLFLPSLEDLDLLYGIKTFEAAKSFLQQLPCKEIYLKAAAEGVFKITKAGAEKVIFKNSVTLPTDFIGAGDVANAELLLNLLKITNP